MFQLSESNLEKLKIARELLNEIIYVGEEALIKLNHVEVNHNLQIFHGCLGRFVHNLDSVHILLEHYPANRNVETAIGLAIRASLLDFMTIAYLFTYSADATKDNPEAHNKYETEIQTLIGDHLYNFIPYIKLMRDKNFINQGVYKTIIKNMWVHFPHAFNTNEIDYERPEQKLLIIKKFKSPKELFLRMSNHPLTKDLAGIYDLYSYYSKYEHFGVLTNFFRNQGINRNFINIITSTDYMVRGMAMCLTYLTFPYEWMIADNEVLTKLRYNYEAFCRIDKNGDFL